METAEKLITENLDVWTSAVKAKSSTGRGRARADELYGFAKLRELILELAISGLLVPQDATDEAAAKLLQSVANEKSKLVADKVMKKEKDLPQISSEEVTRDLPHQWEWCRLGTITRIIRGITFPASEKSKTPEPGRVTCLRTSNVQKEIDWEDLLFIREQFVKREDQFIAKDDIVMSMANSRELVGKVAIVESTPTHKTTFGGFLGVIRTILVDPRFVMIVLRSPKVREVLIGSASQTTNIANVSLGKLKPLVLPLPPLAEQHRIVAKVDELMALCDQLEQEHESSLRSHDTLVATLLGALTEAAASAEAFAQAWQRIQANFDTLFTTESSIDQLKQTILQLAVMGKLARQDSEDQPASASFEAFHDYKRELAERKFIKLKKRSKDVEFDVSQFPGSWELFKWNDISHWITYGFTRPMPHLESGIPIVTGKNVNHSRIDLCNAHFTDEKSFRDLSPKDRPIPGDILITKDGSIGRSAIVEDEEEFCINQSVAVIWLKKMPASRRFLRLVIDSPLTQQHIASHSKGQAIKHLSITDFGNMICPMPPLAEQRRIVAKVDELMGLCDQLKANLAIAQATQLNLADSLVEQAIG